MDEKVIRRKSIGRVLSELKESERYIDVSVGCLDYAKESEIRLLQILAEIHAHPNSILAKATNPEPALRRNRIEARIMRYSFLKNCNDECRESETSSVEVALKKVVKANIPALRMGLISGDLLDDISRKCAAYERNTKAGMPMGNLFEFSK